MHLGLCINGLLICLNDQRSIHNTALTSFHLMLYHFFLHINIYYKCILSFFLHILCISRLGVRALRHLVNTIRFHFMSVANTQINQGVFFIKHYLDHTAFDLRAKS